MTTNIVGAVKGDKELGLLLRRCLADSGLTQAQAADIIGKHQTWFPNYLFKKPVATMRNLFVNEGEKFEAFLKAIKAPRARVLELMEVSAPLPNAAETQLDNLIPVFPAGAGPALDEAEAIDMVIMPRNNGGSHQVIGLRIHGSSMSPYLENGDTAFVALEPALVQPGKAIGVYIPEVGSVVKVLVRIEEDGRLLLQSLNSNTPGGDFFEAPPESRIYGPVINRLKGA